jgi:hypothetical protein
MHSGDTPPPSSSPTSSPPETIQKLRQSINKVKDAMGEFEEQLDAINPKFTKRLGRIFKGSLIQAELGAQRADDIEHILRNREHLKEKKTRRQVKAIGPLCVKDANRLIKARAAKEVEKEWRQFKRRRQTEQTIQQTQDLTTRPQDDQASGQPSLFTIDSPQDFVVLIEQAGRKN